MYHWTYHNDFNDNRDNNNNNDNNDDDKNNNVYSVSLNLRDDLDDLLDKTDSSENRKSKQVAAINADIIRRLNDENFKCFDITNQKGECRKTDFFRFTFRFCVICTFLYIKTLVCIFWTL